MKKQNFSWVILALAVIGFIAALTFSSFAEEKKAESYPYPLQTCVVSGGKLGSMGKPYVFQHKGREVQFCCKGCDKKFNADLAKYEKILDEAVIKQQLADYPLDTCVVSNEKLGEHGEPVNYVHKNRLIRLCCKDCTEEVQKDGDKFVALIDQARANKISAKPVETPEKSTLLETNQPAATTTTTDYDRARGHGH